MCSIRHLRILHNIQCARPQNPSVPDNRFRKLDVLRDIPVFRAVTGIGGIHSLLPCVAPQQYLRQSFQGNIHHVHNPRHHLPRSRFRRLLQYLSLIHIYDERRAQPRLSVYARKRTPAH